MTPVTDTRSRTALVERSEWIFPGRIAFRKAAA